MYLKFSITCNFSSYILFFNLWFYYYCTVLNLINNNNNNNNNSNTNWYQASNVYNFILKKKIKKIKKNVKCKIIVG